MGTDSKNAEGEAGPGEDAWAIDRSGSGTSGSSAGGEAASRGAPVAEGASEPAAARPAEGVGALGPAARGALARMNLRSAIIVGVNMVPAAGVMLFGWSPVAILLLYWLENIVSGVGWKRLIARHERLTQKRGHFRSQLRLSINDRLVPSLQREYGILSTLFAVMQAVLLLPFILFLALTDRFDLVEHLHTLLVMGAVTIALVALEVAPLHLGLAKRSFAWVKARAMRNIATVAVTQVAFGAVVIVVYTAHGGFLMVLALCAAKAVAEIYGQGGGEGALRPSPLVAWIWTERMRAVDAAFADHDEQQGPPPAVDRAVEAHWDSLGEARTEGQVRLLRGAVREQDLAPFTDAEVLAAVTRRRRILERAAALEASGASEAGGAGRAAGAPVAGAGAGASGLAVDRSPPTPGGAGEHGLGADRAASAGAGAAERAADAQLEAASALAVEPQGASGEADLAPLDLDPLGGLRDAHATRDPARIAAAEEALLAEGEAIRCELREALAEERRFEVAVSLEHILRKLEGRHAAAQVLADLESSGPRERRRLSALLLRCDAPEDVPALAAAALGDGGGQRGVRLWPGAAQALGRVTSGGALEALLELARHTDANRRQAAVKALERQGTAEAAAALAELASGDTARGVRADALRGLAAIGDRSHAPLFLRLLEEGDTWDRVRALHFLGRVGVAADLPALEEALARERGLAMQQRVEKALAAVRAREAAA